MIALYRCKECLYSTARRANMEQHLNQVCVDGSYEQFELSHAQFLEAATRNENPEPTRSKRGPISVRGFASSVMVDVLSLHDTEERIECLYSTDLGREICNFLSGVEDPIDVFLYWVDWFLGRSAPNPRFHSVVILVTPRNRKHLAYRDEMESVVVRPLTNDAMMTVLRQIFHLFWRTMIDYPLQHASEDRLAAAEAAELRQRMDSIPSSTPDRKVVRLSDLIEGRVRDALLKNRVLESQSIVRWIPVTRYQS